jgi:LuxR family transcriptional regulator
MEVCRFNRSHGIRSGYAISFPRATHRTGHGIGLSSTTMDQDAADAVWRDWGERIQLLNHVAHLAIRTLPYDPHGRRLTPRQREVLMLIAEGKTVQDVALVVGRTPATIEKHLRLAREALDVETTAQAISKLTLQTVLHRRPA